MEPSLRSRLSAREQCVGTVVTLPDVSLAELTAGALDFVWIDLEHGALGPADVLPLAIGARAAGAASLVRVSPDNHAAIGPALDAGVDGIVAPRVGTAADVARVVERMHYPPDGSRGAAARRASAYGRAPDSAPRPVCMAQVESTAAVDKAEEIAAVRGVDALVVGCGDLALALGADACSDRLRDAVTEVQRAAELAGIASGIAGPHDAGVLADLAGARSTVLVLAADVRIYARALDAGVGELRRELALRAPEREESHVGT